MNTDRDVSRHYSRGNLLDRLNAALAEDGIDSNHPSIEALALYDRFHGRGLEATVEIANLITIGATDPILDIGVPVEVLTESAGRSSNCPRWH